MITMNIFREFRRRKVQREFEKYVPSELVAEAASAIRAGKLPMSEGRHFQFILVHLEEVSTDEIPALIKKVVDGFYRNGATVSDISSSLIVGYFGLPNPKSDLAESRLKLVSDLLAENGSAIRIAHGQCNGLVGSFGTEGRWKYGGIIPNFSEILKKLLESQFGTATEIS
jgi:hypothetical protein